MVSPKIFFRRYIYNNENISTLLSQIVYEVCGTNIYEVNDHCFDQKNNIVTIELIHADNIPVSEFYPIINRAFSRFVNDNKVKTDINIGLKDFKGPDLEGYKDAINIIVSGSVYLLYGAVKTGKYLHIYI